MGVSQLEETLAANPALEDAPEELAADIAKHLYRSADKPRPRSDPDQSD